MKIVTAEALRLIDKKATQRYGIPAIILMENAAISSASCAIKMLAGRQQSSVAFFCGQGNNGGDGFACARHLINRGLKVKIYFAGKKERLTPQAKTNYQILRKIGQKISSSNNLPLIKKEIINVDLIVDALLGIGVQTKVRQPIYGLIELINSSKKPVLSLDLPSGLDATSGKINGIAVRATHTVTFGLFKKGFLNPQVQNYLGQISIADISLPRQLLF